MIQSYLDESGSLPDPANPFVIAICFNAGAEPIHKIIRKVRRKIPHKKNSPDHRQSEIKFFNTTPKTRQRVLTLLAQTNIEVAVIIIDKRNQSIPDRPKYYGAIANALLQSCYRRYPHIALCLDLHFTDWSSREALQKILTEGAKKMDAKITVEMADSQHNASLQIADFLAGAFYYKYSRQDDAYSRLIAEKVYSEQVLRWPIKKDN